MLAYFSFCEIEPSNMDPCFGALGAYLVALSLIHGIQLPPAKPKHPFYRPEFVDHREGALIYPPKNGFGGFGGSDLRTFILKRKEHYSFVAENILYPERNCTGKILSSR